MKVLVVDDDEELAGEIADALRRLGHDVAAATSGHQAIAVAAEFAPDLAILDVLLPDINGITLAAVLRGVVESKRLRVVGVSGIDVDRLAAASARGIFDRYLAKPVSPSAIESLLRLDPSRGGLLGPTRPR